MGRHLDGRIASQRHTSDHLDLSLCHGRLSAKAGEAESWKNWTGQWSQHLFSNRIRTVHLIYDPFTRNMIQLTHITGNLFCLSAALPSPHLRGMRWSGCEGTLWRIVQSFRPARVIRPLISGWVMFGPLCPFRGLGSLMESGVCVMLGSTE